MTALEPHSSPSPECWAPWKRSRGAHSPAPTVAHVTPPHLPYLCSWRAPEHWALASPLEAGTSLEQPRPGSVALASPAATPAPSTQVNAGPSAAGRGLVSDREGPAPRTDLTGLSWGGVLDKVPAVSATRVVTEWTAPAGKACSVPSSRRDPYVSA